MPLYNLVCSTPLSSDQRRAVARAITEVHCRETNALPQFVNVVFLDNYPLPSPQVISLLGGVRTGGNRTVEAVEKLRAALRSELAKVIGIRENAVGAFLIGVPSNWVVEGGDIMPEPGAETEWLARRDR